MQIRERLKPFSHTPGTACLVPGTNTTVRVYPTRLEVGDEVREFPGPAKTCTIQQDLEKGRVLVQGENFREEICGEGAPPTERLFLGSHKKQDWDLIMRRQDLREILPIWFRLGQWMPPQEGSLEIDDYLLASLAYFEGILVPTGQDVHHYGLRPVDPALLLSVGAQQIRSLFFHEDERLHFSSPREFHCGRMTGVKWRLGTLDYEWTKRKVRRVHLHCEKAGTVQCQFPKEMKSFRLRKKERLDVSASFGVSEGEHVLLDRFEK